MAIDECKKHDLGVDIAASIWLVRSRAEGRRDRGAARPCRTDVTPYGRCRLAKLSASILVVSCAIFNQSAARRSQASLSVGLRAVLEFSLHISAICRYRSASFIAIGSTKASLLLC